jgi:hypothetical protein
MQRNAIEYKTGRTYDGPQMLSIIVEDRAEDDFGIEEVTATFSDASRHIKGRVKTLVFNDGLGAAILAAYDAGRYEAI